MLLQIFDSSEKVIAGGRDIQPDVIICQETNHGRIFCCRDPVLYFVQFKAIDSTAYIIRCSPFADMCFQSESLRLCLR